MTQTPPATQNDRDINEAISFNVKTLLGLYGYSQTELAQALGIKRAAMSLKLTGRTNWSAADLAKTATFLDTTADALLSGNLMGRLSEVVNTELTKNPRRHAVGNDGELLRLGLNQRPSD